MPYSGFFPSAVASYIPKREEEDPYKEREALLASLGDENQAFSKVMDARGENPGVSAIPELAEKSPEELAILDRLSSGQQARKSLGLVGSVLGGVAGIAPYEAIKGISQNVPGASKLLMYAGKLTGDPKAEDNYTLNARSSPASMENIYSYFRGALRGR